MNAPHSSAAYASQWLTRLEAIRKEVMQTPAETLPPVSNKQLERLRASEGVGSAARTITQRKDR